MKSIETDKRRKKKNEKPDVMENGIIREAYENKHMKTRERQPLHIWKDALL